MKQVLVRRYTYYSCVPQIPIPLHSSWAKPERTRCVIPVLINTALESHSCVYLGNTPLWFAHRKEERVLSQLDGLTRLLGVRQTLATRS